MTILITGSTGQTGSRVAQLLKDANYPVLLAARSLAKIPEPFRGVYFDWLEPSSYENPFKADPNIDRVYLIGPHLLHMLDIVKEFIELAISKGVKRFVLVSGSCTPQGVKPLGVVHEYLASRGVDYAVLRPTWFFGTLFIQYSMLYVRPLTSSTHREFRYDVLQDYPRRQHDRLCSERWKDSLCVS